MSPESSENPATLSETPAILPGDAASETLPGLTLEKSGASALLDAGAALGRNETLPVPGAAARSISHVLPETATLGLPVHPTTVEPDCVIALDLEGNMLSINAGGRRILGITGTDHPRLKASWAQLWRGPGVEEAQRAVTDGQAGNTRRFEASLATAVGVSKFWGATVSPVPGLDGEPERLLAVMHPVMHPELEVESRRADSDAQFRAAFDQATVGIVSIDGSGKVLWANEAFCSMIGYAAQEIVGRDSRGYTHSGDVEQNSENIRRIQEQDLRRATFEKRYIHKDGRIIWAHINLAPVRDANGQLTSLIGVTEDVTERRQAREALADAQVRLQGALIAGEIGTWVWEIPKNRIFADRNLCRLFFVPEDEGAEGAPVERFTRSIHPADHAAATAKIERVISTGGAFDTEYRVVGPQGELRWLTVRGTVEMDEKGNASRFYGVVLDITDRKQAEESLAVTAQELAQQTRVFNTVLSATEDFAYLFDTEGRFLYANRPLLTIWNTTLAEVVGKSCYDLGYPQWHADMHMREIRQVIETRLPIRGEVPYSSPNGRFGVYDYTFTPVFGADGQVEVIAGTTHDVTEERRSEQDLRDSKERLDLVIEAAQLGTYSWSLPEGSGKIEWNSRLHDLFWFPRDLEITREMMQGKVHPADDALVKRALDRATINGERYDIEYRVRGPHGQIRWLRSIGKSFHDENGVPVRFGGIVIDVTPQKEAEDERQRLVSIVQNSPDFIGISDANAQPIFVNEAGMRLVGLTSLEEAQRLPIKELFVPEDRAKLDSIILPAVLRDGSWTGELSFRNARTGASIPVLYNVFRINDPETGQLTNFATVTRDITERKKAYAEVRDSEARFRQLADSMPQIVWGSAPDGVLDYCNQRWFEYIDRTEQSVSPADWAEYVHPDDLPGAGEAWAAALKEGIRYGTEFRVRRADGAYRWFLVRALPIKDENGTILRWYGTCTDIHDQKEAQREKEELLASERAARTEAERASRMKDEFLSTLSHELRTPLNAILGWAQVLRSPSGGQDGASASVLDEDLELGLATIERNARSQAQIIEDLLDMSRIISGKVRLDVQRVDLAPVVQAALDTMLPAAEAKGIRLQTILDPQARPVSGDPNRLQQVFWNILSNAIKFTPRGGRVQVVLQRINSHLEVSFSDSGEGIAPEFLPHVFDRFRQADASSTRRHGGLGLGLAIVKQLVELHGGTVRASSAGPGAGTTFVVSLPLMIAVNTEAAAGDASPSSQQAEGDQAGMSGNERRHPRAAGFAALGGEILGIKLHGLRVLVVDDEADARALLKRLLEERGAEVLVAGSAQEAFGLVVAKGPDVLVSDIGMPGEDGYSLIRRIRAHEENEAGGNVESATERKKLPAVALTAYARAEDRMKAVLAGFQMHVSKPVEAAELLAMVASLTGRT